jgi:hypothetical protein
VNPAFVATGLKVGVRTMVAARTRLHTQAYIHKLTSTRTRIHAIMHTRMNAHAVVVTEFKRDLRIINIARLVDLQMLHQLLLARLLLHIVLNINN